MTLHLLKMNRYRSMENDFALSRLQTKARLF